MVSNLESGGPGSEGECCKMQSHASPIRDKNVNSEVINGGATSTPKQGTGSNADTDTYLLVIYCRLQCDAGAQDTRLACCQPENKCDACILAAQPSQAKGKGAFVWHGWKSINSGKDDHHYDDVALATGRQDMRPRYIRVIMALRWRHFESRPDRQPDKDPHGQSLSLTLTSSSS